MKTQTKFVNPSILYTMAKPEDRIYFRCYLSLNRKLGPLAGTVLNFLLNAQWRIESDEKTKRRFPNYFRSEKELAEDLGMSTKSIRKALNLLREKELIYTQPKGWPRRNNFYFNQQKIMDLILSEPSHSQSPIGRTI